MPETTPAVVVRSREFGERLRALRRARGLTQQDLADGRYSAAYISMLEAGRTRASMKALEHIAGKLGVSVAELLGGDSHANQVEARLAVAKALVAAEDSERALEVLAEIASESLAPRQLLARRRLEGRAYLQLRRPKEALPSLQRALLLAQRLGDKAEVAHVRSQLGTCCYYTDAYREAIQHHLACLEAIHSGDVRDALLEFRVLSNLGNEHAVIGEYGAAIGYYERALAMSGDVVDQERLAGVHAGLAFTYANREDYEAAITHARSSLILYEQIGAKRTLPEIMNNLAFLYGKVGNRMRADELLLQAIERAKASQNKFILSRLILSRAELVVADDPEVARGLAQEALAVAEATEHREAILSARLFLARQETDAATARRSFEAILAFAHSFEPVRARHVLEVWSEWEEKHGDPRRSAKLAREALHT